MVSRRIEPQTILSRQNQKVKALRAWLHRPALAPYVFVEGAKLGAEALNAGLQCSAIWTCDSETRIAEDIPTYLVGKDMFQQLSTLKSPQPPLFLFQRPTLEMHGFDRIEQGLLIDHIQDPGNAGALVRAAAAFGIRDLLWLSGCDPFHPALIRASAGHVLQVRNWRISTANLKDIPALVYASADARCTLGEFKWPDRFVLALGNEGHGPSNAVIEAAQQGIRIPIANQVESLNVMGAAHILLYAYAAQVGPLKTCKT